MSCSGHDEKAIRRMSRQERELDSCAMSAARLSVEAGSAMGGDRPARRRDLANMARDCDMLARRYGALAEELAGAAGA